MQKLRSIWKWKNLVSFKVVKKKMVNVKKEVVNARQLL